MGKKAAASAYVFNSLQEWNLHEKRKFKSANAVQSPQSNLYALNIQSFEKKKSFLAVL